MAVPLNGCSYSAPELNADADLKQRIQAERRAVWDSVINRPKAQQTDSLNKSAPKPEVVVS
jgi:hypothetical protein